MKAIRILAIVALIAGLLFGAFWLARDRIGIALFRRGMVEALSADPFAGRPDGLGVALCGAGSPMPSADRAGPCTVITAGRHVYLVDIGEGGVRNLARLGYGAIRVEAVFLTHFHSDHIDSLGALMLQHWAGGAATAPLPVYGPPGVDTVTAGFNLAYSLDRGYRIAHHGPKVVPPNGFGLEPLPVTAPADGAPVEIFARDGLQVFAFQVDHRPIVPAYGYLFVYKGRRVVISGDTQPTPSVERAARGGDVLVHEALSTRMVALQQEAARKAGRTNLEHIFHDIRNYHTAPEQAAGIAERAGARLLLLTHIVPPLPYAILEGPFLGDARSRFHGRLIVGHDGDEVLLPANSKAIEFERRF
ncbi:MAG: MBL fold metallo-hydrolase [Sphingomonas sp. 28-66-16]|nr:MAG: MBL fold metallo-hydrolase [Sphingomonas sp. 28-66-16]